MATSAVYINNGTAVQVNGVAGAGVIDWSVEGLANGAGRVSVQVDLGAAPRPERFKWVCEVQFQATPTQGRGLELYIAEALDNAASRMSGDLGTADAALGDVDMRRNLKGIGYVVSENAAASEKCIAFGEFTTTARYITFVAYNDSGASVNATDSNFQFFFQPVFNEGQ
jgi:hypothetical protein